MVFLGLFIFVVVFVVFGVFGFGVFALIMYLTKESNASATIKVKQYSDKPNTIYLYRQGNISGWAVAYKVMYGNKTQGISYKQYVEIPKEDLDGIECFTIKSGFTTTYYPIPETDEPLYLVLSQSFWTGKVIVTRV